jgi:hypothetical protein
LISKDLLKRGIGFILISLLLYGHSTTIKTYPYHFDSWDYWDLANSFGEKGFACFNCYPLTIRGYFFPFFLYLIQQSAIFLGIDQFEWFRFISVALLSFSSFLVIPFIVNKVFNTPFPLWRSAIFAALIYYLFIGLFYFPLSDFLSCFLILISISFLLSDNVKITPLALIPAAIAYYCRPIYLAPFLIIFIFLLIRKNWSRKSILIALMAFSMIFLVSLPQIIINRKHHQSFSPLIIDNFYFKNSLIMAQYRLGISVQKYESYINDKYLFGPLKYYNSTGQSLIQQNDYKSVNNVSDLFGFYIRYPLDFLSIFMNHAFAGMTIQNPMIYVSNPKNANILLTIINAGLLTVFFFSLTLRVPFNIRNTLVFTILLVPILFIIPTQIEERFFLPFFVFISVWALVNIKQVYFGIKNDPFFKGILFFLVFSLFITERANLNGLVKEVPNIYGRIYK